MLVLEHMAVTGNGRIIAKGPQLTMFGERKPVAQPGSRGGRFYQTEQGTLRYGERPAGAHQQSTPYGKLVGRDVSVVGGEHIGKVGHVVAASPLRLQVRLADGHYIQVPHEHVREQLTLRGTR